MYAPPPPYLPLSLSLLHYIYLQVELQLKRQDLEIRKLREANRRTRQHCEDKLKRQKRAHVRANEILEWDHNSKAEQWRVDEERHVSVWERLKRQVVALQGKAEEAESLRSELGYTRTAVSDGKTVVRLLKKNITRDKKRSISTPIPEY